MPRTGWRIPASLAGTVAVALVLGLVVTSNVKISLVGLIPFAVTGLMAGWHFVDPLMRAHYVAAFGCRDQIHLTFGKSSNSLDLHRLLAYS